MNDDRQAAWERYREWYFAPVAGSRWQRPRDAATLRECEARFAAYWKRSQGVKKGQAAKRARGGAPAQGYVTKAQRRAALAQHFTIAINLAG